VTAGVGDYVFTLQFASDFGDRGAADAEHFGEKLLRQRHGVAARAVSGLQQPAGEARFHRMQGIAGGDPRLA